MAVGNINSFEKFVEDISKCLDSNDLATAVKIFNDPDHSHYINNNSWELISIFCKHITRPCKQNNRNLAECCELLLHKLAMEANPEEGILEFLDQMDEIDPEKFRILLDSLQILISRNNSHKLKSLEWTFNNIRAVLEQFIKEDKLDGLYLQAENENLITDEEYEDFVKYMNCVISFFEYFIEENNMNIANHQDSDADCDLNLLLSSRLLQMFDILFPYINLQTFYELKLVLYKMQSLTLQLISNPMSLLEHVFYRALNVMKPKPKQKPLMHTLEEIRNAPNDNDAILDETNNTIHPFEDVIIVSDLAYGMFFFFLLNETKNEQIKLPMVYNPKYVMLSLIHVTIPFFEKKTNAAVNNGLLFLNLLLNQLNDALEKSDLYFSSHRSLLLNLNNIMIFSQEEKNRKLAFECFKKYLNCFNWEGKYFLLLNLRHHVNHPGTLGFLIVSLKEFLSKFLDLPHNSVAFHKFNKYYRGKLLFDIIKKYCFLTNGSKTDLVENADHIISSLNALFYLIVRDKKNVTDIKRFIKKINADFFVPLGEGVIVSRNYYNGKLKEIECCEKASNSQTSSNSDMQLALSVENQILPKLTPVQQKTAYQSCLNAIDLIDLLLQKLVERIFGLCKLRNLSLSSCKNGTDNEEKESSAEDHQYESRIREKILNASLCFIPTHGWSKEAIASGAESLGYAGIASGIFPNGGADLINYFYVQCNQKLKDYMIEVTSKPNYVGEPKEFIRNCVEFRLRMLIPYIKKWPQAIAIMSLPPNVPVALANLLALSDDICFYAGDKSVDFNWYIRRIGVSGIYKVTELYMIQDESADFQDTWNFLDRRLTDAVQLQQIISNSSGATMVAKDVVSAAFTTARNILRLNDPR